MKEMNISRLAACTVVCLGALALLSADTNEQEERKKLVGVWNGFTVEGRGETPDRGPVKLKLTVSEKTIKGIQFDGSKVVDHGEGEFTIDMSQNPKHLDAAKTNERGRKVEYFGIYKLEGDTLKWCVSPRKQRPTDFQTGNGNFLVIVKRQKEALQGQGAK